MSVVSAEAGKIEFSSSVIRRLLFEGHEKVAESVFIPRYRVYFYRNCKFKDKFMVAHH